MYLPKAKANDQILFNRFNETLEATVIKRYENSVVVRLTEDSYKKVHEELPNDLTVVNDRNYQIMYISSENKELA
ncbi:DUF2187 family protein [Lysinibacillus sp. KU-BSD001]|uniref:DUF2187 family protein n=1 Tax=Lysinibacillus sp. KU-BSD001 TaxID=3141328 RepID=UPI0036EEC501